ncbi:DUF4224 domain-containing protein [Collimonas humicola]|uniref:DUF4224 domain-containing protein n=1 Tax=Collimonas humicola TaxID=2825886 RepID=UPI0022A7B284|nr:DUF4224 domain-containing protein [Collimonas humicola]
MGIFLDQNEVSELTGRKMKTRQIVALRQMGIPFFINATGHAIVTRSAIEGRKDDTPKAAWVPRMLRTAG